MTTFTLRKGSPDKTRTDVVVIGVVSTRKGLVAAPGGEAVASAYGRKFAPMLSTLGFKGQARRDREDPDRRHDQVAAADPRRPRRGGRTSAPTSYVVPRASRRAPSPTPPAWPSRCRPADAAHVRAVTEGYLLGGYAFDTYKSSASTDEAGEVVVLSDAARDKSAAAAIETAQVVAAAVSRTRDWVNTPPADLTPARSPTRCPRPPRSTRSPSP